MAQELCTPTLSSELNVDDCMKRAFGATLLNSEGGSQSSSWCGRWEMIIHHMNRQHILPGGSIGRQYVDLLAEDVQQLAAWNVASEQIIVFC